MILLDDVVQVGRRPAVTFRAQFARLLQLGDSLRANINETFLAAQIREQGEKEMNDDRWSESGGVRPAES
jgi:hypothetical protein